MIKDLTSGRNDFVQKCAGEPKSGGKPAFLTQSYLELTCDLSWERLST